MSARYTGPSRGRGMPFSSRGGAPQAANSATDSVYSDSSDKARSGSEGAFSQTLQFITDLKLREVEKQRVAHETHMSRVLKEATIQTQGGEGGDKEPTKEKLVERVRTLLTGLRDWDSQAKVKEFGEGNLHLWLDQAQSDPSIPTSQVLQWSKNVEESINRSYTRYEYARLFGMLLTEWLKSGDSLATQSPATANDQQDIDDSASEASWVAAETPKEERKEKLEQKAKIQTLIFTEKKVDTSGIDSYLTQLFTSTKEGSRALAKVRDQIHNAGERILEEKITSQDLKWLINSLVSRDILTAEKRATVKSFLENQRVLEEIASVLNMQMSTLVGTETEPGSGIFEGGWDWPEEGIKMNMRRHLSGKYRAYMDTEIITSLLFQWIGVKWSIAFKRAFEDVLSSPAWVTSGAPPLSDHDRVLRSTFFNDDSGLKSIHHHRQTRRKTEFFMTQLPDDLEEEVGYDDEPVEGTQQKENSGMQAAQTLMHIVATEIMLQKTLHGECTVLRGDLEWFGPSLPHDSILAVFEFFGMPTAWLSFFKTFLNAKLQFDPDGPLRTRKRGVPIAHSLSVLCGEVVLFGMDFAVNQKAKGLLLYRQYDDFWSVDNSERCQLAWNEMKKYADLVGISFSPKKTGALCIGGKLPSALSNIGSSNSVGWGFLRLDSESGRFTIDQNEVNIHIAELKRQLSTTKSTFGFVNAYGKYLSFFKRSFGTPAQCFGRAHCDEVIATLARIQRELFPETGGSIAGVLKKMIKERFDVEDIPTGWFFLPISNGGLEVQNPMLSYLTVRENLKPHPEFEFHQLKEEGDLAQYDALKYKKPMSTRNKQDPEWKFPSFEEFISNPRDARETHLASWGNLYQSFFQHPNPIFIPLAPELTSDPGLADTYGGLDSSMKWIMSIYAEEILDFFGTIQTIDKGLIPFALVSLFRDAKVSWAQ